MREYIERETAIALAKNIIVPTIYGHNYRHRCIDPQEIAEIPAADVVEIVRCKDCKHRPTKPEKYTDGFDLEFPEDEVCPCYCGDDPFYSWYPSDDWFCPRGERKGGDE